MKKRLSAMLLGALLAGGAAAAEVGIENGGFESFVLVSDPVHAAADKGFGSWQADADRRVPGKWLLNLTSPGRVAVVTDGGAAEGKNYLRITADVDVKHQRGAHLYIFAKGLAEGKKYRLSAKVRNGSADVGFYEYKLDKTMKAVVVCQAVGLPAGEWTEISGEYQVPANFKNACLAIMVPWQKSVEIDAIRLEEVASDGK